MECLWNMKKKNKAVSLYKTHFCFCKILAGRVRQAGNNYLYYYNSRGALEEPAHSRFKSNKIRFLHMKTIVEFSTTGCSEYYQSWLVPKVMGIKILRWLTTTKTLSLRQAQDSQAINHWKLWKQKHKLFLFPHSSWSAHNSSVRILSITVLNQSTYTCYNKVSELPIT